LNGLAIEQELEPAPNRFGVNGSSGAHTGWPSTEGEKFSGRTTPREPSPERMTATFFNNPTTNAIVKNRDVGASGSLADLGQTR
jgi:hypothetical protein